MIYILLVSGLAFLLITLYSLLVSAKAKLAHKQAKNLEDSGKLNEAVEGYEKALQIQTDGELLWKLASLHEKMGRKELAVKRFREIINRKKYPPFAGEFEVNLRIGVLLFNLKRDENAFEVFIKLYKTNKNEQLIIEYLTLIAFGQRRCDIASIFLNQLSSNSNTDSKADSKVFFLSAIAAYEKGNYLKANEMVNKAILKTEEDDWKLILIDGITNYLLSKWDKAIKSLEKILDNDLEPNVMEAVYQVIARCNMKIKSTEESILFIERAYLVLKELYPEYNCESILEDIFFINIKQKNIEKALNYINDLLAKDANAKKWLTIKSILDNIVEQKRFVDNIDKGSNSIASQTSVINPTDVIEEFFVDENIKDLGHIPPLSDFLEIWQRKDILGDIVWDIANLNRDNKFDINRFFDGTFFEPSLKGKHSSTDSKPFCSQFFSFKKKEFLESSRQILKKLNFNLIDEKYSSKDVFLAQGDGIDYTAFLKGSEKEKFVIQIRRWHSDSIGELVIKDSC